MSEVKLINASKLIRQLEICKANANPLDYNTKATYAECIAMVKAMETIEVKYVGQWEWKDTLRCSICNTPSCENLDADIWSAYMPPFCPNCGAKMDEEK